MSEQKITREDIMNMREAMGTLPSQAPKKTYVYKNDISSIDSASGVVESKSVTEHCTSNPTTRVLIPFNAKIRAKLYEIVVFKTPPFAV